MNNKGICLEIGAGISKLGYITVDLYDPRADIKADCSETGFDPNSVSRIYTSHMIEHISPEHFQKALAHWYNILIHQGRLTIRCPNAVIYLQEWLRSQENNDYEYLKNWGIRNVLGWEDKGSGMLNRNLFTVGLLKYYLQKAKFQVESCVVCETRVTNKKHVEYRPNGDIICESIKP